MVSEEDVLLVDAGNSRIKSILLSDVQSGLPDIHQNVDAFLRFIKRYGLISHLYLSNVGKDAITEDIFHYCCLKKIRMEPIYSENENFGIKNSYADVSLMGSDRWLAMVAAQEMTSQSFCVIDVGTAITCDFVVDGQHLGGWIAPGFEVMKNALVEKTARVTANAKIPMNLDVGSNTEDCVSLGCLASVNGVYLTAIDYLASKRSDFSVIIGGGGKNMLAIADSTDTIRSANLVMQGLARYAKSQLFV